MSPPARETRRQGRRMVARQLVARGIRRCRVLAAMAWVPREWFVPPHLAGDAYDDAPLPIGSGQTISQPYIVALMTECLAPRRGDKVLEIGTGSGYQAAVLAHLGARVYTIERLPDLLVEAEERFRRLGLTGIETRLGDGAAGWPEAAPFQGILVTAAAPHVPQPLADQVAPGGGGRLVIPIGALAAAAIRPGAVVAHDSYLINLASPDPRLRARSIRSLVAELMRCRALGIPWVVSHPGNYIDDRAAGLDRNAHGYAECLAAVPGEVGVLIEGTAGAGTALGATFEELRALREALPVAARAPVGL